MNDMMAQWRDGLRSDAEMLMTLQCQMIEMQGAMAEIISAMNEAEKREFEEWEGSWPG